MTPATRNRLPSPAPLAAAVAIAIGISLPAIASGPVPDATGSRYALRQALRQAPRLPEPRQPAKDAAQPRGGNTLPVTHCLDDGSAGSLRAVAASAGEGDTIDLSGLACSTITLSQGPIDTSVLGDNHIYDVTFQGPGRDALTIEAAGASQVFVVGGFSSNTGRAIFNDLTIANGTYTGGLAGCIGGFGGAVELNRVTVTNCHSSGTVPLVFGGAVDVTTLEMTDSTISDSSATATGVNGTAIGGGFYATQSATLVNSTVSGNSVTAPWGQREGYLTAGGGLYTGNLTLTNSTISGNTIEATNAGQLARGGGVFLRGVGTIHGSTIDYNRANGQGGGIFKEIFSNYGDPPPPQDTKLLITNTTISYNVAGSSGGGIYTLRPARVLNSTVSLNHAGLGPGGGLLFGDPALSLEIQSSIFARNSTCDDCSPPLWSDIATPDTQTPLPVAGANNIVMAAVQNIELPADTSTADPLLVPFLSWNGGPTRTLALGDGSPALDAGNNAAELEFDQRGAPFARVAGAAADIGAFERQGPPVIDDRIFADGFEEPGAGQPIEHAIDDGDGDTNMGPPSSFDPDMLWGNYFTAQPGGEFITQVAVAFGPTFPSLADGPVTFWVLHDPDGDGDPRNAYAVGSIEGTPNVFNDEYFEVWIAPTWVSGGFFVGASAKLEGGQDRPARVDTGGDATQAWFFYAPDIAATINDLAAAPFGTRMDDTTYVTFPGVFMVRASGESAP